MIGLMKIIDMKYLPKICIISSFILHLLPGTDSCMLRAQSVHYEIQQVPFTKELTGFSGTCMLEDSDGFMWFGTSNGLYRYDGSTFKIFQHDHFNKNSLSSNFISCLIEDSEGIFWIGTDHGLVRFDRVTETFKRYLYSPVSMIYHVIEGRDGYLWMSGQDLGFCRFDRTSETFLTFDISQFDTYIQTPFVKGNLISCHLYEDRSGVIWIRVGMKEMYAFHKDTEAFTRVREVPCDLNNFYEDRSGQFWITSWDGLYTFNRGTGTFQRHLYKPDDPERLKNQMVRNILEDGNGNYWISTYDGIYLYNPRLERMARWDYPYEYNRTSDFEVLTKDLCLDHTGTLWYFTKEGISKIAEAYDNFSVYDPYPATNTTISGISTDRNNNIWFTDGDAVYRFDRQTKDYRRFFIEPGDVCDPYDGKSFATNILIDEKDVLWVSAAERGFYKGAITDDGYVEFERYFPDPVDSTDIPSLFGGDFFLDSDDRLWVNRLWGIPFYVDRDQDRVFHLVNNPDSKYQLLGEYYIIEESNSKSLLANGWYQDSAYICEIIPPFIRVSKDIVMPTDVIRLKPELGERAWYNNILRPSGDSLGFIWITNFESSVLQQLRTVDFAARRGVTTNPRHYTIRNGLPGRVMSMLEGNHGMLWLATDGGLARFDPSTGEFMNFTVYHGLHTYDFMYPKYRSPAGELFFGTTNGLISFYPDSLRYNTHVPEVVLTGLKVNNQNITVDDDPLLDKDITYTSAIDLSYRQNNLSFEFTALNYIRPQLNQYMYMLEGYNNDWIHAGNRNHVDYTNLRPGRYMFRVLGSNNDGVWNEVGAALDIHIHAPPWLTWWSYLIYGFILTGLVLLYRRYLVSRARLKTAIELERIEKEKVRELDQMKSRFFANISHEFRTPLTLLTGPIEEIRKHLPDPSGRIHGFLDTMKSNAQRLNRLINQLLDLSRIETGNFKLQVSEGNLSDFIRTIALSFLSLAESKNIRYQFTIPRLKDSVYFDADKLEKILINLISNAFKFTADGGQIKVNLKYVNPEGKKTPSQAVISVRDTGKGIGKDDMEKIFERFYQVSSSDTREYDGTGIGLSLTKELVDICRGEIKLNSEIGKGSTFSVILPVSRSEFADDEIIEKTYAEAQVKDQGILLKEEESIVNPDKDRGILETGEEPLVDQDRDQNIILIVEDNTDLRDYISRNLGESYVIIESGNGNDGFNRAIETIPDLIISDIMMPEMDGIEMCAKLKDDIRTSHIPIVLLTAKAGRDSKLEGLETGADDYIIKPFDAEELKIRVKNLIIQRKKLREKFHRDFFINEKIPQLTNADERFVQKAKTVIENHMTNPDFNTNSFSQRLGISRMQLYRKLRGFADQSPSEFIRNIRLKHSVILLKEGNDNITQIAYHVGFNDPTYYSTCFRELYGVPPSEYLAGNKDNPPARLD